MALTKGKIGQFIELKDIRNSDLRYGEDRVRGVNTSKHMMPTKANLASRDLSKFQVVEPGWFFFNHRTSRNGSKFSITYNDTNEDIICTEDYVVFRVSGYGLKYIIPEWLFMFFNRPEFDRFVITNSWGSSTEFYNWEDICDVDIVLPDLPIQQKYVDVYNAMLANQLSYERGLEDLKLVCDALLDQYKTIAQLRAVGDLVGDVDVRNSDGTITSAQGINISKQFMPSVASSDDLSKYKVVTKGQFAYSAMQTGRDECIRIALQGDDDPIIVSPAYSVLQVKDSSALAEYIMMWFSRKESDRLGWFMSDASIRSNLDLNRFYDIKIPVPDIASQQYIVNLYIAYQLRREINEQLKSQIKGLCPILIKGSLEEGEN